MPKQTSIIINIPGLERRQILVRVQGEHINQTHICVDSRLKFGAPTWRPLLDYELRLEGIDE